jgi:hypothetical protein
MKTKALTGISIAAAVLVAGGSTLWLFAGRGDKTRVRPIAHETVDSTSTGSNHVDGDQSAALRRRVAELELKVAALSSRAAARASYETAKAEDARSEEVEALTPEQQVERDAEQWEDHMDEVASNFEAETRDGRWAQETSNLLTARAAGNVAMRTAIKRIDCRSATCRVEMVDDQKGAFGRQLSVFVQSLGGVFPLAEVRTVDNPDGTETLSVYFSTKGNSDPRG